MSENTPENRRKAWNFDPPASPSQTATTPTRRSVSAVEACEIAMAAIGRNERIRAEGRDEAARRDAAIDSLGASEWAASPAVDATADPTTSDIGTWSSPTHLVIPYANVREIVRVLRGVVGPLTPDTPVDAMSNDDLSYALGSSILELKYRAVDATAPTPPAIETLLKDTDPVSLAEWEVGDVYRLVQQLAAELRALSARCARAERQAASFQKITYDMIAEREQANRASEKASRASANLRELLAASRARTQAAEARLASFLSAVEGAEADYRRREADTEWDERFANMTAANALAELRRLFDTPQEPQ